MNYTFPSWPALVAALSMGAAATTCHAADRPSRLVSPLSPTQNVIIENTAITTGEFWSAYTSEVPEQRRRAELFLLGVLDATESVSWCDYGAYKTITIDETIFSQLRKLPVEKRNERAAKVIGRILSKSFPCGRKQ